MTKPTNSTPRVAIVVDWLTNMGGAERTVLAMHHAFPDAPIFTSVFEPEAMPLFKGADIRTSFLLQHLPKKLRKRHQLFPVFRAFTFRRLKLQDYDVILSSASAEAKAARAPKGGVHICYCHTPIRYYWSHYQEYRRHPGFGMLDPLIKLIIPPFVKWMRRSDLRSVEGVDYFLANSHEVQRRIRKYYHRDSTVMFPPVDTERMRPAKTVSKDNYYLVVGRQIPYKRMDLAIKACNRLGKRLIVVGNGSEHEKLRRLAGPTVEFKTGVSDQEIVAYFQHAKALIWPQVEDFGITAVEAMAAGTPVIAYKKAGALDYMVEGKTGLFFAEQTVDSLTYALKRVEKMRFDSTTLVHHAEKFSEERFIQELREFARFHATQRAAM